VRQGARGAITGVPNLPMTRRSRMPDDQRWRIAVHRCASRNEAAATVADETSTLLQHHITASAVSPPAWIASSDNGQ